MNDRILKLAEWEKRLLNFFIDLTICSVISVLFFGGILSIFENENRILFGKLIQESDFPIAFIFLAYYFTMELMAGKTIGKYITKTKVVGWGGKKPTMKQIFIRTITRLLLIEVISFFSRKPSG